MMIRDDQCDAALFRHLRRLDRGDAAIDGDDQLCAAVADLRDGVAIQAIPFFDAMRNVVIDLAAELTDRVPEDGGGGDAVDVVVAVDDDLSRSRMDLAMRSDAIDRFGISAGSCRHLSVGRRNISPSPGSEIPRFSSICAMRGLVFSRCARISASAWGVARFHLRGRYIRVRWITCKPTSV